MKPAAFGIMIFGLLGCQTTEVTTNDGRALPPLPTPIPQPPENIQIDAMT